MKSDYFFLMPQAWEAFSEGKCIDRTLISSERAYSKCAALKCHWFPYQEKTETKPEWMTKKKIMELQILVFSYEKITVPPEVSVRDNKSCAGKKH